MNKEQTKEAIKVMQAYVDGAAVEVAHISGLSFERTSEPVWNWGDYIYRIKPEPREWYEVAPISPVTTTYGNIQFECAEDARRFMLGNGLKHHFVVKISEVLDDKP